LVLAVSPNPEQAIRRPLVTLCFLLLVCLAALIREQAAADVEGSLERWVAINSPTSELGYSVLSVSGPWYAIVEVTWVPLALAVLALSALMSWEVWASGGWAKRADLSDDAYPDVPDTWVPCPRCGGRNLAMASFTWWGGFVGQKLLSHVECWSCRTTFNAKTGRSNMPAILIYNAVGIAIALGILLGAMFHLDLV
jgi:hypothetical protein